MGYALAQICPNQRRAKSKIAFGDVYLNKKEVKNKWKKIALLVLVTLALLCTTGALALLYNNYASSICQKKLHLKFKIGKVRNMIK